MNQYELIIITYYNQINNKIIIQGKPLLLFLDAKEIITDLVDYEDIPKVLNTYFKVSLNKDDIIEQAKLLFPNTYRYTFTDKLRKCILQAVFSMNLHGNMFDYTGLVFHGYRALEGHLRYVLKESGIPLSGPNFDIFNCSKQLRDDLKTKIYNKISNHTRAAAVIKYIEETYQYFGDKRHVYFHWNNPNITNIDYTRIIDTEATAHALIRESLEFIENYYKI